MLNLIVIFFLGTCLGSFLNVCVYRMPRGESIIFPGSHCPICKKDIRWYQNIPVFSFVFLKGHCKNCGGKISFLYPIVEILSGLLALVLFLKFGLTYKFFVYAMLFYVLLIASFIDFKTFEISNGIILFLLISGIILSLIFPGLHKKAFFTKSIFESVLGILVGGGIMYVTASIGNFLLKKETMGGADIKLMAAIGAFLGWKNCIYIFFLSPIFGLIFAIFVLLKKKESIIPYAPFISMATVFVVFYADVLQRLFF